MDHNSYFLAQLLEPTASPHKLNAPTGLISEHPAHLTNRQAKGLKRSVKLKHPSVLLEALLRQCVCFPIIYSITELHNSPTVLFIIIYY